MVRHVIIDGNNLLHALYAHAPIAKVGRETMVKMIERWARQDENKVTLVFDGPTPKRGMAAQMASKRIDVRYSAPKTADDIIVRMIQEERHPETLQIVSSDRAIGYEARYRRGTVMDSVAFVAELFPERDTPSPSRADSDDQPETPPTKNTEDWLKMFGVELEDEPFDGHDAMES